MDKVMIRIDEISPYDGHHPPTDDGWRDVEAKLSDPASTKGYHDKGARVVLDGILNGGEITPIAVRLTKNVYFDIKRKYERLDGWKRYMGSKLAGKQTIPCYVFAEEGSYGGIQQGCELWEIEPKGSHV